MPAHLYIHHSNVRRSDDPMNHTSYNVHSTQRLEAAYEHSTPPSLDDSPPLTTYHHLIARLHLITGNLDLSQDQHSFFWQNQPHIGPQEPPYDSVVDDYAATNNVATQLLSQCTLPFSAGEASFQPALAAQPNWDSSSVPFGYFNGMPDSNTYQQWHSQYPEPPADQSFPASFSDELWQTDHLEPGYSFPETANPDPETKKKKECHVCHRLLNSAKLRRHHQDVHEKPPKGATPCKGYYMCTCGEHWSTSRKREILIHLEEIKEDSEHLLEHCIYRFVCRCEETFSVGCLDDYIVHIKGCMNGVTPGRPRCDSSTVPQRSMSVPPLVS
ncbi:hypothetical protein PG987_008500 [Apiospora arundinis]